MLFDAIWDWNPWWDKTYSIDHLIGRPRIELTDLLLPLNDPKVTILSGIRRAGKTTLMYQMIDHLLKNDVDPDTILFLGLEDPAFTNQTLDKLIHEYMKNKMPSGKLYIFLDEIQSYEGWERFIRKELDQKKSIKYVVTGSSSSLLTGEYATLLTGRNLTYFISPLSFRNFIEFFTGQPAPSEVRGELRHKISGYFLKYLEIGGFPEVVLQPSELRKPTLNQYFHDIIHRDIIRLHSTDPKKVSMLASYLLLNIGGTITLSSLRRALGFSYDAIRDYLRYLEEAGLFHFIREFSFSPKPAPREYGKMKVYCADLGIARMAFGRHSRDYGRFGENAVFLELSQRRERIGYFFGRREVDFVSIDSHNKLYLTNVCMASDIPEREFEGLREFITRYPRSKPITHILTDDLETQIDDIELLPIWKWLLI